MASPSVSLPLSLPLRPPPAPARRAARQPLRRITIRARLFATFALMCALMAVLGAVAWWSTSTQNQAFNAFLDGAVGALRQGGDLRAAMVGVQARERDVLLAAGHRERHAGAVQAWRAEVDKVDQGLDQLQVHMRHAEALAHLGTLRGAFRAYRNRIAPVFDQLQSGALATPEAARTASIEADAEYRRAEEAMQQGFALFDGVLAQVVRRINGLAGTLLAVVFAALGLAMLVAAVAGWAIGRSIHRPLRAAKAFAARLQGGDLTARIDQDGRDEITELCQALHAMQEGLRHVVAQVRQASAEIATGSTQIAVGSVELSQRTDEQASSLEETAASMEELTSTVQQNAQAAQHARQLSAQAADAAERGSAVAGQVQETMERISASSTRIADIIGLIDHIAFRTNILALNAAVESARAGVHGRGFAVVAGEVRSLAQRSAEAAREIRGLIADSVRTVQEGSQQAHDAGGAMAAILLQVRKVDDLVAQISAASAEQSTGIAQVGEALAQLDRVTQQNAALVEESAAAAESLKHQAARMERTVAVFRVD